MSIQRLKGDEIIFKIDNKIDPIISFSLVILFLLILGTPSYENGSFMISCKTFQAY